MTEEIKYPCKDCVHVNVPFHEEPCKSCASPRYGGFEPKEEKEVKI